MDNAIPLTLVLHFDYVPYDERTDEGWEQALIVSEVLDEIRRMERNSTGIRLVDHEVQDALPRLRQALKEFDAGRKPV